MATINQLYKTYVEPKSGDLKFNEWINTEKQIYKERNPQISFDNWMNKRYCVVKSNFMNDRWAEAYTNANAETEEDKKNWAGKIQGWFQTGANVAGAINEAKENQGANDGSDGGGSDDDSEEKSTFLGLPQWAAVGLGILLVGGAIATTVYFVRKSKK